MVHVVRRSKTMHQGGGINDQDQMSDPGHGCEVRD
jgi:hypothetical protein